jgi:hypothetical protein
MNWEAIGAISDMVGVVVLVITLIYVAMQIRQNNELLRSQSRQALVTNDVSSLSANLGLTDIFAKYVSGAGLSDEEQLKISFMFALDLRNREFEYFQYKNGLLDKETWLAYRNVILINHSSELGKRWWDRVGRGIVDPMFAKQIDELLVGSEPDDTYKRMAIWANEQ